MRMVLPATAIGLIILASFVPVAPVRAADLDANKHIVHDYIETAINKRRPDVVTDYFAANYIEHNPHLPPGLAGKKQFIGSLMVGFSDYHGEIEEIIADGDKVVTRTRWTGTQDGPFLGRPATGNKLDFTTADFYRVEDGKIIEHWDVVDSLARAIGLGLISPPK
ncbi:MAG TPA: ester cyclase [Stellaceae bacterium]